MTMTKKEERELARLKKENQIFHSALVELSCLGNGPHYGNSEGNCIAQKAIKEAMRL